VQLPGSAGFCRSLSSKDTSVGTALVGSSKMYCDELPRPFEDANKRTIRSGRCSMYLLSCPGHCFANGLGLIQSFSYYTAWLC
jgi:hypothetical protein